MEAVQTIAVVPFFHRFRGLNVALIGPHVDGRVEVKRPGASPCAELHFIMRVRAAGVEDDRLARCHVRTDVLCPQLAMDQRGRDLAAVGLQSTQEPWDDNINQLLAGSIVLGPGVRWFRCRT